MKIENGDKQIDAVDWRLKVAALKAIRSSSAAWDHHRARTFQCAVGSTEEFVKKRLALSDPTLLRRGSSAEMMNSPGVDAGPTRVVVDVTHTYLTGMMTGIQRVVTNLVKEWLASKKMITLVVFDERYGLYRVVPSNAFLASIGQSTEGEVLERIRSLDTLPVAELSGQVMVVLELPDTQRRVQVLADLISLGQLGTCAVLVHDLVPLALPSTTHGGMPGFFLQYLEFVSMANIRWTNSESTRRQLEAYLRLKPRKDDQVVLPFPLPNEGLPGLARNQTLRRETPLRKRLKARSRLCSILMVGSIEPRKNYLRALMAVERLWSSGNSFQLVIASGRSWESSSVEEAVRHLMTRRRPISLVTKPSDDQLLQLYNDSDILLFPSLGEGFGLPVSEALSLGCSVVTSDRGATAEFARFTIFEDSRSVLVDSTNVSSIEDGISQVLKLRNESLAASETLEGSPRSLQNVGTWSSYSEDIWASLESKLREDARGKIGTI